ncbi:hemerythrin domain-containing protein [Tsukamurella sp. 8F]|uniref:hemerythrin domain-containing protein n=1 Tax=unclassified Tsukamurella TaxID=2633480 RepID=UPI0023B89317|nr:MULTISPECIES: hemerythrin domain-containing protein [unclassified Tsukamurella]MDF0532105.1 hemerythrin domain-containing protein [Tsukamurella sp. 8J]MDF0589217.1 hemerythrin domain-containing protein [Tsukamurella sp. 8F]
MTIIHPSTAHDVVDVLVDQHHRIMQLFDRVIASEVEERESAFFELRRLLAVHETAEELIVHPRARRDIVDGRGIVQDRLDEERSAKRILAELEDMDVQSDSFVTKVEELRDAVTRHAEHEEHDEFIALRTGLDDHEAARMAKAVELAESVAPTHPHPSVNTGPENLIVGPFAAMLDRARDAILAPTEDVRPGGE